jgi:hypothetical protein
MDGTYMIEFGRVPSGFRVKDLSGDTAPHTYTPPYSSYIYYYTTCDVWRRTTGNGKWEFDSDKSGCSRDYRPVIIRECGIPTDPETLAQKCYQEMVENDKRKGSILMDNPILKEVKSKMLQLIDVILFNRKTKEIDFRKEIVAVDR